MTTYYIDTVILSNQLEVPVTYVHTLGILSVTNNYINASFQLATHSISWELSSAYTIIKQ